MAKSRYSDSRSSVSAASKNDRMRKRARQSTSKNTRGSSRSESSKGSSRSGSSRSSRDIRADISRSSRSSRNSSRSASWSDRSSSSNSRSNSDKAKDSNNCKGRRSKSIASEKIKKIVNMAKRGPYKKSKTSASPKKKVVVPMKNKRHIPAKMQRCRGRCMNPETPANEKCRVEQPRGCGSFNGSLAKLPGDRAIMDMSKIPTSPAMPHSPNSHSGRTSTPLPPTKDTLYRTSIINRARQAEAEVDVEFDRPKNAVPAVPAPPTMPLQATNVSRSDSVQDDVRCNLQLPLFIESIHKVHVVPKKEVIIIESATVLVSKDTNMEDAENLHMVPPSVDHLNVEKEKGHDEEVSENRVLIGKNAVLFKRNIQIKRSELLQNLVTQTKKEHNRIGTCKVDEASGPLSIHCAQSTVVNGDIYHKKELISLFLTAEPRSLEDKELIGIMSKRLIREETPEVGNSIKSAEKMMNNGKYILTLERDIRLLVTNEMWTNDNEYTMTEKRCFEFGQSNNGDFSIIERSHQVSKSILELNPTFLNGSTRPNMTGPYASSIYHNPQGKAVNKTEQTVAPAKDTPETTGSFPKTSDGSRKTPEENKCKMAPPVYDVIDDEVYCFEYMNNSLHKEEETPKETRKTIERYSLDDFMTPEEKKKVLAASIPLIKTPPKRVSFSQNTTNGALNTTPEIPKTEGNYMENARTNDNNFRIACTPAAVAGSQSPSMLSRSLNPITPEKSNNQNNDVESRRDHKKTVDTPVAIEFMDKTINICKNGSVDSVQTRSVPMEVIASINDVPYKIKMNLKIQNDSKEVNFVPKKIEIDGNTLWQEEPNKLDQTMMGDVKDSEEKKDEEKKEASPITISM